MANVFSQQQIEGILGLAPGQATGGFAQNLINTDPTAAAKYQSALAATGRPALGATATPTTGAMPVGVEPLHQFERAGLSGLGNYQVPSSIAGASGFMQNLLPQAQQQLAPMTDEQFQAGIQRYTNPYQQQVTDIAQQDVMSRADELRNRIRSRNPGARSFGSSSQGVQLGSVAGDELSALGEIAATSGARGFEGAVTNLMRDRQLQQGGLGTLGNLAQGLGSLGTRQQQAEMGALAGQQAAGQDIRQFNQGLSDLAMQNYMGAQNFPYTQMSQLGQLAGVIPQTRTTPITQYSSGQQLAGGLMGLGGLINPQPVVL